MYDSLWRGRKKWEILHERLRRIDFWSDNQIKNPINLEDYSAILVNEVHLPEVQIFRLTNRIRTNAEYLAVVLTTGIISDEEGLSEIKHTGKKEMSDVRKLFHDLNQAKEVWL